MSQPQPGTKTAPAPGFFPTMFRLCAGTKVMTEIYEASPARAIWHFFLLTILCSVMAAIVATIMQKDMFERAGRNLDEEIGAFVITPEKISVQKDPDTPRRFKLPYVTLEYFPGDTFSAEDFNVGRTSEHGIVVLPGGLATWAGFNWNGEDLLYASLMPVSVLYASLSPNVNDAVDNLGMNGERFSGPGFAEVLKQNFTASAAKPSGDASEEDLPPILATGSQAARLAVSLLTALVLLVTFGRNLLVIGVIVLLVSLVQYLRASTLPKGLLYRNVLTIMVYSTFPAQIAATLFDAAGGDRLISFQLLFVGIFFVYQLFAFRAVLKKVCPQIDRKDDDLDDSDF